jgi:hypothetical protein
MNEELEIIDSNNAKILSEFKHIDEIIDNQYAFRLSVLDNNFIILTQSVRAITQEKNLVPSDEEINLDFEEFSADEFENEAEKVKAKAENLERVKSFYQDSIKRNWWKGSIAFEKKNLSTFKKTLDEILSGKLVELNKEHLEINQGKDKLKIGINSTWGHTDLAPQEKAFIQNLREIELDNSEIKYSTLYLNIPTFRKLNEEISKIIKSNNLGE